MNVVAERPLERLVGFGRHLRAIGLPVGPGRVLAFCRAATVLDPFDETDLQLAARATLVSSRADLDVLDRAFDRYFGSGWGGVLEPVPAPPNAGSERPAEAGARDDGREGGSAGVSTWRLAERDDEPDERGAIPVVASDVEVLRTKDFGAMTDEERRRAMAAVRRLTLTLPLKHSRRSRPSPTGERFDLRRTLRRSMRTEGEPFDRRWRTRQHRRRPLVLLLDVSGSMAPYSRPLVEFAHAAAMAGRRVEVFCFGTRLTRITRAVRRRDPAEALGAVATAVTDWQGGTRIGRSLAELLEQWSSRSALRGSVVVLCSDGLERGDPGELARQMGRLSRLAHRVVWVNPLKGSPRYEPLARGMAASLPFVDVFLAGHDVRSLEALAEAVAAA